MSILFKNSLTLSSSSRLLSSSSCFLSSSSPSSSSFPPGRLLQAVVANLPCSDPNHRLFLLRNSYYSTVPPPAPPPPSLSTSAIYPPPSPSSSPSPPPLSQPTTSPTPSSSPLSPPKPINKSLLRRLLRFTFLFNTSLILLTLFAGGSLWIYYSYIAPAKVVYRRGRDGLEYAVGVYGSAKGAVGKGREWYGWMTGEEGRVVETEEVAVEEKKKKGWFW